MKLEDIMVNETSQLQKEKCRMIPFCEVSKSQTHRSRESNGGCQELGEGGSGELLFNEYQVSVMQDE